MGIQDVFKSFANKDEELSIRLAHETIVGGLEVISTGSLSLDDALSCGGIPKGRIIQYYGKPASGKTLMAMINLKEAQLEDPKAKQLWIDAEGTFDSSWAAKLGINTSKVLIFDGEEASNGRSLFEILLGIPKEDSKTHEYKGKSKPGILDCISNKEDNINYIALDSLGVIIPPGEDVSRVGKMNMALQARFLTPTFKKLSVEVKKANIPFIVINHQRDNMDPFSFVDHTFSGGNSYAHSLSANVYFRQSGKSEDIILNEQGEKIGTTINAVVEKSKFGPHPRKCEFKVNFLKGITSRTSEAVDIGLKYGIITQEGVRTYSYENVRGNSKDNFINALDERKDLVDEIVSKIKYERELINQKLLLEQEQLKEDSSLDKKKTKKTE